MPGSAKPGRKEPNKTTLATSAGTSVDQALPTAPLAWAERRVTYHSRAYLILIYQSVRCVVGG